MSDEFSWFRRRGERPKLLGHRGVMGLAPENTMASFRRAVELGCDILELDVHLSRDGELMVIHDETIERTTTGRGAVRSLSSAVLRRCDAGVKFSPRFRGERVPFLAEVLELARSSGVALNIEIKNGPEFPRAMAGKVTRLVARMGFAPRTVISSFDHEVLRECKRMDDSIATAALSVARMHDTIGYLRRLRADGYHPRWNYLTRDLVRTLRAEGFFVNTWIAHDHATWRRLAAWGVDAIGVNDPGFLRKSRARSR